MMAVIGAVVLALVGVILSFTEHASPEGIRRSLLVGLEIGAPYVIYVKWIYRRNRGFYAAIYAKGWLRMTFAEQMRHQFMLVVPPIFVFTFVFLMLIDSHRILMGPWLAAFSLPSIFVYPEQKAIWLAAKARLAESENGA